MAKIFASRSPEISAREKCSMERVRRIAAEGMVLLENSGALPLKADGRALAVFGSGVRKMVKSGSSSGDVNSRTVINVEQGLEDAGFRIATRSWLDRFDAACTEKGFAGVNWVLDNPYRNPDVPEITPEDVEGTDRDCVLYVIARTSGEGADRKLAPGDYELSDREKDNLRTLTAHYDHTVVILSVSGVIDTKFLRETKGIDAILLMSQPGCAAGYALADVLTGKVSPSGHLTSTWTENYSDYPRAGAFSYLSGDLDDSCYNECTAAEQHGENHQITSHFRLASLIPTSPLRHCLTIFIFSSGSHLWAMMHNFTPPMRNTFAFSLSLIGGAYQSHRLL